MVVDQITIERFEAKIFYCTITGCWLWSAGEKGKGYGKWAVGPEQWRAHRFAYELWVGPIPKGLVLDHVCRVRLCVNPNHLEPKTAGQNLLAPGSLWVPVNERIKK